MKFILIKYNEIIKLMNLPSKKIINRYIYLFSYNLIKNIIYDEDNSKKTENIRKNKHLKKIKLFIAIANEKINHRIAKYSSNKETRKLKELTTEYSKENFENIILFLKQQNQIYIGDILDNILIQICGFAMKIDPYETISENIFDNLNSNKGDLEDTERVRKFINVEVFKDTKIRQNLYPPFKSITICPFLYLLFYSYKAKLDVINNNQKYYNYNITKCIFNYYFDNIKNYFINGISKTINSCLSDKLEEEDQSLFFNIHYLAKYLFKEFDKINKLLDENVNDDIKLKQETPIGLIEYFFYILFIYYKTKTDHLINYSKPNNNKENNIINIPFTYDMEYGFINCFYALMVTSPIKTIKNIKHVSFCQNNLGDIGLFEIGKVLIFNKEIETLNYNKNLLRSFYFSYFTYTQRIFKNYTIKKISLNNNIYIKEDFDILLCEIIKIFKGLKVINISNNELKSGIKNFCIELKKLYRENKCEIEELNFDKCIINDESIYELSELLKLKKCKLKILNLNKSNLKDAPKIFKCIKKNKSLLKLYVSNCKINNNMIKIINKIISLSPNLEEIDIAKNCIKSSDHLTRLLNRAKVIVDEHSHLTVKTSIINNSVHLCFLDISQNPIDYFQTKFIDNLKDIIPKSNLKILDCTKIIFGANPLFYEQKEKTKSQNDYSEYTKSNFIILNEKNKSDKVKLIV